MCVWEVDNHGNHESARGLSKPAWLGSPKSWSPEKGLRAKASYHEAVGTCSDELSKAYSHFEERAIASDEKCEARAFEERALASDENASPLMQCFR